jgi:C_GCAxxG_C_C family probable redox protein
VTDRFRERALTSFLARKGYHCAEAILLGLKEELALDSSLIPRIASPFGGGLGRSGGLCGVVSGSLMALGILKGRDTAEERVEPVLEETRSFLAGFRERFGTVECRELTGYDLSSSIQRKLFVIKGVREKTCAGLLEWAVAELEKHLP